MALQVGVAVSSTALITLLGRAFEVQLHLPGVVMLFFLGVVLCAYGSGVYASGLSALLSVGAFTALVTFGVLFYVVMGLFD